MNIVLRRADGEALWEEMQHTTWTDATRELRAALDAPPSADGCVTIRDRQTTPVLVSCAQFYGVPHWVGSTA